MTKKQDAVSSIFKLIYEKGFRQIRLCEYGKNIQIDLLNADSEQILLFARTLVKDKLIGKEDSKTLSELLDTARGACHENDIPQRGKYVVVELPNGETFGGKVIRSEEQMFVVGNEQGNELIVHKTANGCGFEVRHRVFITF